MDQSEVDEVTKEAEETRTEATEGADIVQRAQDVSAPEDAGCDDTTNVTGDEDEENQTGSPASQKKVSGVEFDELEKGDIDRKPMDLDFILDIPLTVSVELGRGKMMISELLQLGQGSVVELTKVAGEPLEIFVNERLIAMGEVVVINEKFGIRLTDVVSPSERIAKLA